MKAFRGKAHSVTTAPSNFSIDRRSGVNDVRWSAAPKGATEARSSFNQTVIRRVLRSGMSPFNGKRPPPVTASASTREKRCHLSKPPWASNTSSRRDDILFGPLFVQAVDGKAADSHLNSEFHFSRSWALR